MYIKIMKPVLFLIGSFILFGCACPANESKCYELSSELTKLSSSVEAETQFGETPTDMSDAELLRRATAHDPAQLEPFSDYLVKVSRQGKFSSVMVCTADGKQALLEDAGCSARLDAQIWRDRPGAACEFLVLLSDVCTNNDK